MKKPTLLLVLLCITLSLTAQDKRLKNVEKDLNTILEATQAAGFAVAVVDSVNILYSKGFGFRDYENKIPVDTETLFAIGSSTKAFTSGLLGLLRADDKLSFDDNPRDYIPTLEFYNDAMNQQVIIKDLMRHSTGLPRHDGSWYLFPSHSKDSLIERMRYQEPFTGVRQQWAYNNFGFLIQGVIAEQLTGKTWEDNLKTHFFTPLGMSRTNASIAEMKASSNAALGYQLKDDVITKMEYYDIAGMSPAGSINSSVTDMSKWVMTWINKGQFQGQEILPTNYVTEAINSQMVVGPAAPDDEFPDIHFSNYGYGWFLKSYKGHYRVEHGGNIDGFSANVAFFPSDGIGIIVLTNQNGSAVPSLVRNTIADRMIGAERTDWVKRYKTKLAKRKTAEAKMKINAETANVKNTNPSHSNHDYTGHYANGGFGDF
jgi:CubicO group peptidase (beta-lactamase class C family)